MRKVGTFFLLSLIGIMGGCTTPGTETLYLSGQGPDDAVAWEFYCTDGWGAGQWSTINVPSNWELEGFGRYNYGLDKNKSDEMGQYRTTFRIPAQWKDKQIRLVFEGVMTDTEVFVNGTPAGDIHQGGFYEFEYDITSLIKPNSDNLLEVNVRKVSTDATVEAAERQADYWVFGGIYRPVYLKALPTEYIDWTAIDARADGAFRADVYLNGIQTCDSVTAQILDGQDKPVGKSFTTAVTKGQTQCTLKTNAANPKQWTAETPHLYSVRLNLNRGGKMVHSVTERFGFRTFEVRSSGLFLNGQRIMLKGVNRHSFRPESGRCLSPQDDEEDVRLLKSMNMNAARCSHYPPNRAFLDACDELGLYVLDELAGWHKPAYNTAVGKKLLKEMVKRDVNHPCILFWDNGNEGGWNSELDDDFAKYDPQNRPVLHPWTTFSGVNTTHYESYENTVNHLKGPALFMPTEFLHGLYDGGMGAGLDDYWQAIKQSPFGAGGFLWVFADEGVVRTDQYGEIDTDGNHAPDGIVGPYLQKEGSYFTIRHVWSPVQVQLDRLLANGRVPVQNEYGFTNLNEVEFTWQLVDFASASAEATGHTVRRQGKLYGPDIAPGQKGVLELDLPDDWQSYEALYLTANRQGNSVWTWSLPLKSAKQTASKYIETDKSAQINIVSKEDIIRVTAGEFEYVFGAADGLLRKVTSGYRIYALTNGPRRVPPEQTGQTPTVSCSEKDGVCLLKVKNSGGLDSFQWTIYPNGDLRLKYAYSMAGAYEYFGITFDLPETEMKSMRWLGQGPRRVWKNRLKGTRLDVWQRDYNRGVPGYVWDYPVFSGCYADLYWLDLQTDAGAVQVFNTVDDLFFRVGALRNGPDPINVRISPIDGDLSFLHAISPIGTKTKKPVDMGPSGQLTTANGTYKGDLVFRFE